MYPQVANIHKPEPIDYAHATKSATCS